LFDLLKIEILSEAPFLPDYCMLITYCDYLIPGNKGNFYADWLIATGLKHSSMSASKKQAFAG
jgi:hypothetical protein